MIMKQKQAVLYQAGTIAVLIVACIVLGAIVDGKPHVWGENLSHGDGRNGGYETTADYGGLDDFDYETERAKDDSSLVPAGEVDVPEMKQKEAEQ